MICSKKLIQISLAIMLMTYSSVARADSCEEIGRFQIFKDAAGWTYMLDTVTGKVTFVDLKAIWEAASLKDRTENSKDQK